MLPAPTADEVAGSLDRARNKAAIHLELLAERLTEKALDPVASVKTMLDAAEFNYKLSGLAGRQAPAQTGGGFRLNIILGGDRKGEVLVVGKEDEGRVIDVVPEYVKDLPLLNDLVVDDAPDV